tara:strand:- start:214 stop:1068 length:855 start_codon:yes stop_codon:yes gene_type:complete
MSRILALFDGSIYSQSVCNHTSWAAERGSASIDVLHVLGRRDGPGAPADFSGSLNADARAILLAELAQLDEQKAILAQKRGRLILDEAKACLQRAGATDVTTKLRHGDLVETVQDFEGGTDLIVIGKRGEAADFAKLHLGSNLERLARSSHKPILVASRAFKPISRFLIAFDGSASALKAVEFVEANALLRGLECHILMVGSETEEAKASLDQTTTRLQALGYTVHAKIESGQADAVIAAAVESEGIDLLVMGAYGHSRIRNLIIGSTTTEMIRSCKIPVILCR